MPRLAPLPSASCFAVFAFMLCDTPAGAQTIQPRLMASRSSVETAASAWETAIAVGATQTMAVHHVFSSSTQNAFGYALAELQGGTWSWVAEGIINPGSGFSLMADPSVAYNPITGEFLVCGLYFPPGAPVQILVTRWNGLSFAPWQVVHTDPPGLTVRSSDKPWIVTGQMLAATGPIGDIQEFYIAWLQELRVAYLRSTDGGSNWAGELTQFTMERWPVPRVHSTHVNRPLYVAYITTNELNGRNTVQMLRGDDVTGGLTQFGQLVVDAQNTPLSVDLNRKRHPQADQDQIDNRLPGGANPNGTGGIIGVPGAGVEIAVDPTSVNRLYLVYHDTATATAGDNDVNIYLHKLTRSGSIWTVGPRLQVNTDTTVNPADQFMPAIKVDASGRIHVIFYDDRKYNITSDQLDGPATPFPKFDVFYARSTNQGQDWSNQELCDDPPTCLNTQEALEYADFGAGPGTFLLKDYIGIEVGSDRVWTSFMGSSPLDTTTHKSLIWSSQILYVP